MLASRSSAPASVLAPNSSLDPAMVSSSSSSSLSSSSSSAAASAVVVVTPVSDVSIASVSPTIANVDSSEAQSTEKVQSIAPAYAASFVPSSSNDCNECAFTEKAHGECKLEAERIHMPFVQPSAADTTATESAVVSQEERESTSSDDIPYTQASHREDNASSSGVANTDQSKLVEVVYSLQANIIAQQKVFNHLRPFAV